MSVLSLGLGGGNRKPTFAELAAVSSPPLTLLNGNYSLQPGDNNVTFRTDGNAAATVAVPGNLPEGFNVAFAQWGTGAVTFVATSGATKRGSGSSTAQYGFTNVIVGKNVDGSSAEFVVLGGM